MNKDKLVEKLRNIQNEIECDNYIWENIEDLIEEIGRGNTKMNTITIIKDGITMEINENRVAIAPEGYTRWDLNALLDVEVVMDAYDIELTEKQKMSVVNKFMDTYEYSDGNAYIYIYDCIKNELGDDLQ